MLQPGYGVDGLHRLIAQAWYFSLSVAYLRRLGQEVVLHTDPLGNAILGHLPYARIEIPLHARGVHPRFWAAGKFVSLLMESGPVAHIDGDVFIKSPECLERIEALMEQRRVVVQSTDPAKMYGMEKPLFEAEADFCASHYCIPDGRDAYNTGILGFADDETRREVCKNYLEVARYFSSKYASGLDQAEYFTPDLIAEQKMIEGYLRAHGITPGLLLKDPKEATSLGYQHVYTIDKFNSLPRCAATLQAVAPDIFEKTRDLTHGLTEIKLNLPEKNDN